MSAPETGAADSAQLATVTAVIVTRNRLSDLRVCLAAVRAQSAVPKTIVVVNNASSDGTEAFLATQDDVTVVSLPTNTGGAGGFAAGLAQAMAGSDGWVWLMDDDAVPDVDCLREQLRVAATIGADVPLAGVAAAVQYGDEPGVVGYRRNPSHGVSSEIKPDVRRSRSPRWVEIDWAPFLGILLSLQACRSVGAIRADFFIWSDDTEYCLRLRYAGWTLVGASDAVVRHPAPILLTRTILAKTFSVGYNPTVWKEYYGVRNRFLLDRSFDMTPLRDGRPLARRLLDELRACVAIALVDKRWPDRVRMRLVGLADGARGRTGMRVIPR